jgi:hypothetical protein
MRWPSQTTLIGPSLVQMMSKHKVPKTVMRYGHGREILGQNAVNFLVYDEE